MSSISLISSMALYSYGLLEEDFCLQNNGDLNKLYEDAFKVGLYGMVVLLRTGEDHDSVEKWTSTWSAFILAILKQMTCSYICVKASLHFHFHLLPSVCVNLYLLFFLWKIITMNCSQKDYKKCAWKLVPNIYLKRKNMQQHF